MPSIQSLREAAESKRCPFGVSERCISNDCAAWKEGHTSDRTSTTSGRVEVSYEVEPPGVGLLFGLLGTEGWERVAYRTEEVGGVDDYGRDDRETRKVYRWERHHPGRVTIVESGKPYGYCTRL